MAYGLICKLWIVFLFDSFAFNQTSAAGHVDCPCLTPAEAALEEYANTSAGHRAANLSGYGIGCAEHDAAPPFVYPACEAQVPEPYCNMRWCFVSKQCKLNSRHSEILCAGYYSYATCGSLDHFDSNALGRAIGGLELKIAHMHNTGGWKGTFCEQGSEECGGVVGKFLGAMIQKSGAIPNLITSFYGGPLANYPIAFPEEVLNLLEQYMPASTSTFDACVFATGLGFIDLCVGAFSMTTNRSFVSSFVHLFAEPIILITTYQKEDTDWWTQLSKVFKPFQATTWLAMVLLLLLASWTMAVMEYMEGLSADGTLLHVLTSYSFIGLQSFVDASCEFQPKSAGGRIISFGIGLFLLLMVSAYTANLASVLIAQDRSTASVSSWQSVLDDPSIRVCMVEAMYDFTIDELGLPTAQAVVFKSREDVIASVGTSTCLAGMTSLEDFQTAQAGSSVSFCNLVRVGDLPLYVQDFGAPVSTRFASSINYWTVLSRREGLWHKFQTSLKPSTGICVNEAQQDAQAQAQLGLPVEDAIGAFVCAGVCCIMGVTFDVTRKLLNTEIKKVPPKEIDPPVPGTEQSCEGGPTVRRSRKRVPTQVLQREDAEKDGRRSTESSEEGLTASGVSLDEKKAWNAEEVAELVERSVEKALRRVSFPDVVIVSRHGTNSSVNAEIKYYDC